MTVREIDPGVPTSTGVSHEDVLDYVSVGPILSIVGGLAPATGFGVEGSWMEYASGRVPSPGYGAFLQTQLYDGKYLRAALGAQGALGPVGVALGLAYRETDGKYASTIAGLGTVYLSIGYLYLGVQVAPALVGLPSREGSFGFETGVTIGLKLPFAVRGRDPTGMVLQASPVSW